MQVALTQAQGVTLAKLIAKHLDAHGLLLTAQAGGVVYAAFNQASFTITAAGIAEAEDFG